MADPDREGEFDEAKLEEGLLEDFEIKALREWCLSHPKSSVEAGEALTSPPTLKIETSSSGPATATTCI